MMWTTQPRSDFATLQAIRKGTGPEVLLIHGVGLRAEAWAAQIAALEHEFLISAPDMPGHGNSPHPKPPISLVSFIDPIAEAIEKPVVIIGHSMGALIALYLAARFPNLVRGVAALSAVFRRSPEASRAVKMRAAALEDMPQIDPDETLRRWFGEAENPESAACRHWLTTNSKEGYQQAYHVFAHEDGPSEETLSEIRCPALFVTGEDEPNATPAMSHAMADLTEFGEAVIIRNAKHMMPMTHPEAVNAVLQGFVQECWQ